MSVLAQPDARVGMARSVAISQNVINNVINRHYLADLPSLVSI
jgi:hypothetical protein